MGNSTSSRFKKAPHSTSIPPSKSDIAGGSVAAVESAKPTSTSHNNIETTTTTTTKNVGEAGEEATKTKDEDEESRPLEFEYRITEHYHHADPSVRLSDESIREQIQEKIDIYSFEASTAGFLNHGHPLLLPPTRVSYFFEHHPRLDRNVTIPPQSQGVSGFLLQAQSIDTQRDILAEMAFEENEAYDSLCDEAAVRLEVYEAFVQHVEELAATATATATENPHGEGVVPPAAPGAATAHGDAETAHRLLHNGFVHIAAFTQDKDLALVRHHHGDDYSRYVHSKSPFQLQQWIHDMETQLIHLPWTPQDLKFQLTFLVHAIFHFHDATHQFHHNDNYASGHRGKHGATPMDPALQAELDRFEAGELDHNVEALHQLRFHCFEAYAHIRGDRRRRAVFHLNTWRHMHHHHYDAPPHVAPTSDFHLNQIVQMELEPYLELHYEKDIREYLSSHASHQMGYWTELLELYHRALVKDYFYRFDPHHVETTTVMSAENVKRLFTDYVRHSFLPPDTTTTHGRSHSYQQEAPQPLNAFELNQLMRWCWHLEKALANYHVPVAAYDGPPTPYKESSSPQVTNTLYHEHGTYDEYPHELEDDSGIVLRC